MQASPGMSAGTLLPFGGGGLFERLSGRVWASTLWFYASLEPYLKSPAASVFLDFQATVWLDYGYKSPAEI